MAVGWGARLLLHHADHPVTQHRHRIFFIAWMNSIANREPTRNLGLELVRVTEAATGIADGDLLRGVKYFGSDAYGKIERAQFDSLLICCDSSSRPAKFPLPPFCPGI